MTVSDTGQARVFFINILFGILCVILFELFSVLCDKYGKTKVRLYIINAVFFVSCFGLVLYAQIKYNLGALRYYQIIGLLTGITVYKVIFGRWTKKFFSFFVDKGTKCFMVILRIHFIPLLFILKLFFSAAEKAEKKILDAGHNVDKIRKKVRIKREKKKKIVKKRFRMI